MNGEEIRNQVISAIFAAADRNVFAVREVVSRASQDHQSALNLLAVSAMLSVSLEFHEHRQLDRGPFFAGVSDETTPPGIRAYMQAMSQCYGALEAASGNRDAGAVVGSSAFWENATQDLQTAVTLLSVFISNAEQVEIEATAYAALMTAGQSVCDHGTLKASKVWGFSV